MFDYEMKVFSCFAELKEEMPETANKLFNEIGKGEWMNNQLYVFPNDWEFAKYELTDGWYSNCFKSSYNGAPNPLDYIEMDAFARALINGWDDGTNIEIGEQIISTNYGW